MKEYIYINGNSSVEIEKDEGAVTKVFIDKKEHQFDEDDTQDKEEYAIQTKRNKYQKFLNNQFENLIILTGAGSSVGIGKGDKKGKLLSELWDETKNNLGEKRFKKLCELVRYQDIDDDGEYIKNLEKLLSMANAAKNFVPPTEDLNIADTIKNIENLIKTECELELPSDSPHHTFLERITLRKPTLPRVKLFTLNYDTLFEQAGRVGNFTIIDGFSFSFPRVFSGRNFDYDIVYRDKSRLKAEDNFINRVFHLYKPHGSVDWEKIKGKVIQSDSVEKALMIYPKDSKYENSYEQPFFEMMSRFQHNLRKENTLLICIGFSFNDKHIVTAIKEALEQNSGFQLMVVNKGIDISENFKWLYDLALNHPSIILIDELFSDFANHYPVLKSYEQDDRKKIIINLGEDNAD